MNFVTEYLRHVFWIFVSHVFYGKSGSCDGWNLFCDREIPGAGIWETVERLKVDGRMGWVIPVTRVSNDMVGVQI